MTHHPNGWLAVRIVHLPGGCRAVNNLDPGVKFEPFAVNGKIATITTRAYATLFADLHTLGLKPFGVDFYSTGLEIKRLIPPDWRPFHQWSDTTWPCSDEADRWAQIGHAAFSRKDARFWDVSSRVSHQIRVCSWRLRQVSEAYREQLFAKASREKHSAGTRFEDGFTWLAYLSIQAFLVDASVLRDYLAEFYAQHLCPDPGLLVGRPITSMGSLKKRVLDKITSPDTVTNMLQVATSSGGWLRKLGSYRDLVVHSAPLAKARGRLVAVLEELSLGEGALPAVRLPIPADPDDVSKSRASGSHFDDFENQYELFVRANHGDAESSDGLNYCYGVLEDLVGLARQIGIMSPIPPEIPHFDKTNIIGEIKVSRC
ncbi:MAG: hypothetical protein IE917_03500 [Betaproteobacteria bacterium]|nr:hypothetical protein [Betaproteobacteria bacterium]